MYISLITKNDIHRYMCIHLITKLMKSQKIVFFLFHFINEVLETSKLETLDISLSFYKELHLFYSGCLMTTLIS